MDGNKLHCQTLVSTSEPAYGTTTVLKITQKAGNYCFFWVKNGKIIRMYYGLERFAGVNQPNEKAGEVIKKFIVR